MLRLLKEHSLHFPIKYANDASASQFKAHHQRSTRLFDTLGKGMQMFAVR